MGGGGGGGGGRSRRKIYIPEDEVQRRENFINWWMLLHIALPGSCPKPLNSHFSPMMTSKVVAGTSEVVVQQT